MIHILLCLLTVAAVVNPLLFGGHVFSSVVVALGALALLSLRLFFATRIKAAWLRPLSIAGVVVLIAIGFWSGLRPVADGWTAYQDRLEQAERQLEQGDGFKAGETLHALREQYGDNDALRLLRARAAIQKNDYDEATSALHAFSDRKQPAYYTARGYLYLQRQDHERALELYVEGATVWPLWSEMQLLAGTQAIQNRQYAVGEYFLLRAAEQMPQNPLPLYHLGVSRFEQGNAAEADVYFNEALGLRLDDTHAGYVAWYRQQMGGDTK